MPVFWVQLAGAGGGDEELVLQRSWPVFSSLTAASDPGGADPGAQLLVNPPEQSCKAEGPSGHLRNSFSCLALKMGKGGKYNQTIKD